MTTEPNGPTLFVCSCERSMTFDAGAVGRGCAGRLATADQLCRAELDRFRAALAGGGPVTVGCVQEQPLFEEVAAEEGFAGPLAFANLRETGGWAAEGADAGPKAAALMAAAQIPMPEIAVETVESGGVVLILGRDETAIEAGRRLADTLDVTVLLRDPGDVAPRRRTAFPVLKGRARAAKGHLGAFAVTVDDYAAPAPSSRARLIWGTERDGATSTCDLILDLTGDAPLFPAHDLRDGYLRADPRDAAAVGRAIFDAAQLVGTFDKPRYVTFDSGLCAHSRSRKTGCTRCLDVCPAGAITSSGDTVAIDPMICAGCGQCASVCPTGAASYALPPVDALAARIRAALRAFRAAGGAGAVILLHDAAHGEPLIDALARFGAGLPARVVPLAVNEITQIGPETFAAALAWGAAGVRVLGSGRPRHDREALRRAIALAETVCEGLGYGPRRVGLIETDDPDALAALLAGLPAPLAHEPAGFLPPATKRSLLTLAFGELHRVAPAPADAIPLPASAPFGAVAVDPDKCTLCLACVSACPAGALLDNPDLPQLRFDESLCVQCGLCERTCPETAISLVPRLAVPAWAAGPAVMKQEEPFPCTVCGKPFGARSTIERVTQKLSAHWMFAGPEGEARRRVLTMCEDCRVETVVNEGFDPHDEGTRAMRTTADYLRERGDA